MKGSEVLVRMIYINLELSHWNLSSSICTIGPVSLKKLSKRRRYERCKLNTWEHTTLLAKQLLLMCLLLFMFIYGAHCQLQLRVSASLVNNGRTIDWSMMDFSVIIISLACNNGPTLPGTLLLSIWSHGRMVLYSCLALLMRFLKKIFHGLHPTRRAVFYRLFYRVGQKNQITSTRSIAAGDLSIPRSVLVEP